ncbi:aminopeptidase [Stutzerimonas urumqiensis]|uniref:aminopeptidase n=1 Tax=Stutzerimonas urumqiensis TaxID=638269 RepID=UPI003BAD973B
MPTRKTASADIRRCPWVPLLLALTTSGCSTYYGQLAAGHLRLLTAREPVAEIVADPARDSRLRARLAAALDARRFASAQLGLPDNDSYRLYADLDRPYVVWNLFATPAFSVEPIEHCFPIAGCVAYRGYFDQGRARAQAARLALRGLDTDVAGVEAYSTLGWFDDPLLSSMLRRDDQALAALIFHELAHQRLYVEGDTAFNESYASFVAREGLRQWRVARGLPAPDPAVEARRRQWVALVLETRERLRTLYAQAIPDVVKRARKEAEFLRLRSAYAALRDGPWQGDRRFDGWFEQPLNNAVLVPFGLYDQWVDAFAVLFAEVGGDWQRFHRRVADLAALPADERTARLRALDIR